MSRYIDADKLLESGLHYSCGIDDERGMFVPLGDVLKSIKEMPTAIVEEVKHGEWQTEKREVYGLPATYHVCSKCGTEYPATFMAACCADFEEDKAVFDYCPKCGAKMDGKESGE